MVKVVQSGRELLKTEQDITFVKNTFTRKLTENLNLIPVSSPLIVLDGTGINDDLNGVERAVKFPIKSMDDRKGVVVHSLAKWKRIRLRDLEIEEDEGILTDMHALRPDEDYSPIHSVFVDQWDWEKRIAAYDRTDAYLEKTVRAIYKALYETEQEVQYLHPELKAVLPEEIKFITAEELLQRYPDLTPKQRESAITKEYGAVFLQGIGGKLSNGEPHDGRAPDYDDWSTDNRYGLKGLNGDILVWNPVLESVLELSSMGIRVDKEALKKQLEIRGQQDKKSLLYHAMLLNGELPEAIGGGIGQSRVCMFMLKKSHIGEVQVSIWSDEHRNGLAEKNICLL